MVGEDRDAAAADLASQVRALLRVVDLTVVLVDEAQVAVEHRRRLVQHLRERADRGEDRRVVRMVVDDDAGVGREAVELGVDVDRGRHVPASGDLHTVGVRPGTGRKP